MEINRRTYINGKLGKIIGTYTHTFDVFIVKTKQTMNIKRGLVKLIPLNKQNTNQLKLF